MVSSIRLVDAEDVNVNRSPRKLKRHKNPRRLYIIHFSHPLIGYKLGLTNPYGGPNHYVGISYRVEHRIEQHLNGVGANKTQRAFKLNIHMQAFITDEPGNTTRESYVTKHVYEFCPICSIS